MNLITIIPKDNRRGNGIPKYDDNPAMDKGYIPNSKLVQTQYKRLSTILGKIKDISHNQIIFPETQDINDDFIFIRDSFISDQKNNIIISNFIINERKAETKIINNILIKLLKENKIRKHILEKEPKQLLQDALNN